MGYTNIAIVVHANNRKEAIERSRAVLDDLCERRSAFGFYKTMDDAFLRRTNIPMCMKAKGRRGKKLIEKYMKWTKQEFHKSVVEIKKIINEHTIEELYENDPEDFTYSCRMASQAIGTSVHLYDEESCPISTPKGLHTALTVPAGYYEDDSETKNMEAWVVPACVHD